MFGSVWALGFTHRTRPPSSAPCSVTAIALCPALPGVQLAANYHRPLTEEPARSRAAAALVLLFVFVFVFAGRLALRVRVRFRVRRAGGFRAPVRFRIRPRPCSGRLFRVRVRHDEQAKNTSL